MVLWYHHHPVLQGKHYLITAIHALILRVMSEILHRGFSTSVLFISDVSAYWTTIQNWSLELYLNYLNQQCHQALLFYIQCQILWMSFLQLHTHPRTHTAYADRKRMGGRLLVMMKTAHLSGFIILHVGVSKGNLMDSGFAKSVRNVEIHELHWHIFLSVYVIVQDIVTLCIMP